MTIARSCIFTSMTKKKNNKKKEAKCISETESDTF